jgi:death-on-curing protein
MSQFLSPEQIWDIHRTVQRRNGAPATLRDYALLESAAMAPQESRFGELINKTLRAQAATYWLSLALNKPFAEGNERTGLIVCEVFLQMNGFQLDLSAEQIQEIISRIASRQITAKDKLIQSLRLRPC